MKKSSLVEYALIVLMHSGIVLSMNSAIFNRRDFGLVEALVDYAKQVFDEHLRRRLLLVNYDSSTRTEVANEIVRYFNNVDQPLITTMVPPKTGRNDEVRTSARTLASHSRQESSPLYRHDNVESSISFVVFRDTLTGTCFANEAWIRTPVWNSRARFLLIITSPSAENFTEITELFRECWKKANLLNLAVVYLASPSVCNGGEQYSIRAKELNPFIDPNCVMNVTVSGTRRKREHDMFQEKLGNLFGYEIPVFFNHSHPFLEVRYEQGGELAFDGPDGHIFNTLLAKFNFTAMPATNISSDFRIEDLSPEEKHYYKNGLNANEEALLPSNINRSSYPFYHDYISVIVPKAFPLPRYMHAILPFTQGMWALYIFSLISLCAAGATLNYFDIHEHVQVRSSVFEAFQLLITGTANIRRLSFVQRLFLTVCFVFTIVVNNAYQGSMTSVLTKTLYQPDLNTYEDILKSDLRIAVFFDSSYADETSKDLETNDSDDDDFVERVVDKMEFIADDHEALMMAAIHRNVCRPTYRFLAEILIEHEDFYNAGEPLLHIAEEKSLPLLEVWSPKHRDSVFLEKISRISTNLVTGGMIEKWRSDMQYAELISRHRRKTSFRTGIKLTLEHLQAAFFILGIGLLIAVLMFVAETVFSLTAVQLCFVTLKRFLSSSK